MARGACPPAADPISESPRRSGYRRVARTPPRTPRQYGDSSWNFLLVRNRTRYPKKITHNMYHTVTRLGREGFAGLSGEDGVLSTQYSVPSTQYPVLSTQYSVPSTL